jgi:hypothetical protein
LSATAEHGLTLPAAEAAAVKEVFLNPGVERNIDGESHSYETCSGFGYPHVQKRHLRFRSPLRFHAITGATPQRDENEMMTLPLAKSGEFQPVGRAPQP